MKISNIRQLHSAINELEWLKEKAEERLPNKFRELGDSIKPSALIKNWFTKTGSPSGLHSRILNAMLGIGSGIIANKFFAGSKASFLKKIGGRLVQLGVTNAVIKNANAIKAVGKSVVKNIFKRKKTYTY